MDTRHEKQQTQQAHQVAQPADGSLKMHGDQLENPLHDMLEDGSHASEPEDESAAGGNHSDSGKTVQRQ